MADTLDELLYPDDGSFLYVLLDGAAIPDLLDHIYEHDPAYFCLFRGKLEDDMAVVAPYVVQVEIGTPLADWLFTDGWGKHWGIYVQSSQPLVIVRRHFRQFLTVYDEAGESFMFRFYDPRVLRVYLPTCNEQELAEFFGPISTMLMEDEDAGKLLDFRIEDNQLHRGEKKLQRSAA